MQIKCPACESTEITSREEVSSFTPLFGSPFEFQEVVHTCGNCQLEGDFNLDPKTNNEALFDAAESAAQLRDTAHLIESLKGKGIRMAQAERALGLPQRTMFRWKNEGITSAAFSLLNIIHEFPGLLEVCEERFSNESKRKFFWAQNICVQSSSVKTHGETVIEYPTLEEPVAA